MPGAFARPLYDRLVIDPETGPRSRDLSEAEAIASIEAAIAELLATRTWPGGPRFGIPARPTAPDVERAIRHAEPRLHGARVVELQADRRGFRILVEARLGPEASRRRFAARSP